MPSKELPLIAVFANERRLYLDAFQVGQPRPMARSPPMHASPMGGQMGHVGGAGGGGFGVASGGIGAHRPAVRMELDDLGGALTECRGGRGYHATTCHSH